ncbi:MAG: alanine--tRNA ligase, partial [Firmicutes bacterium]|nr:alanine--tRNA ligase [Bacillota bacterium]
EDNFAKTIDKGEAIIKEYMDELKAAGQTVLDGEKTFKLYDTYGFPLELTEEILAENGFTADVEGFKANMQKQKDMARAGRKVGEDEAWKDADFELNVEKTVFTGYDELQSSVKISALVVGGGLAESASKGNKVQVILDRTPFYAEGGGQAADTGHIMVGENDIRIDSVEKKDGIFYHAGEVVKGTVKVGDEAAAFVDDIKRNKTARNHTATHLLQKALRQVIGTHVQQAGSSVNENILRFDFSHFEAVTKEQLAEVEALVNLHINAFHQVEVAEMSMEEAQAAGAMALFGEKYGSTVRVVNCGNWSVELCGGTHVKNTGEIGAFKILSEGGVASGVRRIEATTGTGVLAKANEAEAVVAEVADALKANKAAVVDKARALAEEVKALKKELEELKKAAMGGEVDKMIADAKEINGVKLVTAKFEDYNINDLRGLSDDIKKAHKGIAMVFATVNGPKVTFMVSLTDDLLDKGYHAGNMIKQIAAACGGGGGGKADMAQAGAKDVAKIEDAFKVAESLL